jgi:hypothetical protein
MTSIRENRDREERTEQFGDADGFHKTSDMDCRFATGVMGRPEKPWTETRGQILAKAEALCTVLHLYFGLCR